MSLLRYSALTVVLILGVAAIPIPDDNSLEEGEVIDLSVLGDKMYGNPKNSSGEKLSAWNPETSKENAEETGEYAQGDILFPPDASRNGLKSESTRWPNGIIYYVIEGSYPESVRTKIKEAIADYHRLTCLRFVEGARNQRDYISIVSKNTGCWSSVGRIGGRQELNLQNPGCVNAKGTIVHELMHAIGFLHEQSREERDSYVKINYGNVKSGEGHNFDKAKSGTTNSFGVAYDYGSVMHYSNYAFSQNGQPTITSKVNNVEMGQRKGLSRNDVQKINAMYKCPKKKDPPPSGWQNDVWVGTEQ